MQFWLKHSIALCIAGMVVGCASPEDQVIDEDHEYVNTGERGPLVLPPGAKRPQGTGEYILPEHKSRGPVGQDLDIQAPPQLLALASGSRLDEKNTVNRIWFDKTNVVEDLSSFTFDALKSYLSIRKVEGSELNNDAKTMITGWINNTKEDSFWLWGGDSTTTSHRFDVKQAVSAKGLVTRVDVKLVGHRVDGEEISLSSMTQEQINRAEISFLNDYIFHFQLIQEDLMRNAQVASTDDFSFTFGKTAKGSFAFQSDKDVETVWVSIRTLLENVGFTVDDIDRTSKKLYATYEKPELGFWGSLWSDDEDIDLQIPHGQYVIRVTNDDERKSKVVFFDQSEQELSESLYQNMQSTLVRMGQKLGLKL